MNVCGKRSVQFLCRCLPSKSVTIAIEFFHLNNGGSNLFKSQYKTQFRWKSSLLSRPVSVKLSDEKEMNYNDPTTSNGNSLPIICLTSSPAMNDMMTRSTSIRGLSSGTAGTTADLGGKRQQQSSTSFRERASERAGRVGKHIKETAGHYGQQIRDTATEFREKPVEVTKQGAKTFGGMLRQYGPVFVGTYFSVYMTTLGLLFSGVHSGILDPVALLSLLGHGGGGAEGETLSTVQLVVKFMNKYDFTRPYSPIMETYPAAANLAVAWIAIKFTEPIRLPTALFLTPHVARLIGWTEKKTEKK